MDQSARIHQSAFRLTSTRQDGSAAFQKGVTEFRQGKLKEALGEFEVAATAEPKNALYHYHRALAMFDLAGAEAGHEALQQAIELETREPVKNWGKRMERVQGRGRVWIESARRNAGLVR
jgi:Flp pilus assembly protein TadD